MELRYGAKSWPRSRMAACFSSLRPHSLVASDLAVPFRIAENTQLV